MKTGLLIIDPQNDFCDTPDTNPALAVSGAHNDMLRLSSWIKNNEVSSIAVTLDSHHRVGIERPGFWKNVQPFTVITREDVLNGKYQLKDEKNMAHVLWYLESLESQGKFNLMVWPTHCEIGTWGHNIHKDLMESIGTWEEQNQKVATMIFKGMNPYTEHYSAIRAEVPTDEVNTQNNYQLINWLLDHEKIYVAGEASSHCVRFTIEMAVDAMPELAKKFVLLTDCMSPVTGFEKSQEEFFEKLSKLGATLEVSNKSNNLTI